MMFEVMLEVTSSKDYVSQSAAVFVWRDGSKQREETLDKEGVLIQASEV